MRHLLAIPAAALLLGGCAAPAAPRVYTLQHGPATPPAAAPGGPQRFIDVAQVVLPERLRRRQIVLRSDGTQLRILEQDRWSAMLPDELHDAISVGLQSTLGAVDVSQTGLAGAKPVYRVSIEFSQLDAQLGGQVQAAVAWSARQVASGKGQVCQARFGEPAGGTVDSVVAAHQRLVAQVVDAVAASQRAAEQGGQAPFCSAV